MTSLRCFTCMQHQEPPDRPSPHCCICRERRLHSLHTLRPLRESRARCVSHKPNRRCLDTCNMWWHFDFAGSWRNVDTPQSSLPREKYFKWSVTGRSQKGMVPSTLTEKKLAAVPSSKVRAGGSCRVSCHPPISDGTLFCCSLKKSMAVCDDVARNVWHLRPLDTKHNVAVVYDACVMK